MYHKDKTRGSQKFFKTESRKGFSDPCKQNMDTKSVFNQIESLSKGNIKPDACFKIYGIIWDIKLLLF